MSHIKIENISSADNKVIANLIKKVLVEFGAPKVGFVNLNAPIGNTGYYSFTTYMIKDL